MGGETGNYRQVLWYAHKGKIVGTNINDYCNLQNLDKDYGN